MEMIRKYAPALLLLVVLAATFSVYSLGFHGPFLFDDFPNFVENPAIAITRLDFDSLWHAAFSSSSGGLQRPISMLTFAFNYRMAGFDPYYFKLTNVIIHLLNGVAVCIFVRLVLGVYRERFEPLLTARYAQWVALIVSAMWLLHPLNITSVLYVVQRMTSLATLFTLVGLIFYIRGRLRMATGSGGLTQVLIGIFVFTPLAALCKENGALLPAFMLLVELIFFHLQIPNPKARYVLVLIFGGLVVVPAVGFVVYAIARPDWLPNQYAHRDFTLSERVMTEARVLWLYLQMIVVPKTSLMGLFHDDIPISRGLFEPATTLPATLGVLGLAVTALLARKRLPILAFGLLLFLLGHSMESTVLPLELVHEHRNYFPMIGILLPLGFYALYPLRSRNTVRPRHVFAVVFLGLFAFNTAIRASDANDLGDLYQSMVRDHPNSYRVHTGMGTVYARFPEIDPDQPDKYYNLARQHYERATVLQANSTDALVSLMLLTAARSKTIENGWLAQLRDRLEHQPFAANSADSLIKLQDCAGASRCKLSPEQVRQLFEAALVNPTLSGGRKALVLFGLSTYIVNVERDYSGGIRNMYQAVAAAPDEPDFRMTLVQLLIALNDFERAREQLAELKKRDKLHTFDRQIANEESALQAAQRKIEAEQGHS
jgi:protein O-mannosyl-transferase